MTALRNTKLKYSSISKGRSDLPWPALSLSKGPVGEDIVGNMSDGFPSLVTGPAGVDTGAPFAKLFLHLDFLVMSYCAAET